MIRGTTPILEFLLPFDTFLLSLAFVTFSQDNNVVFEKTMEECECVGNRMTVHLTQEDTLKLTQGRPVEIQIRAKTTSGEALASDIMRTNAERILKDGAI